MNKYPRIIICLFMWLCFLNVVFAADLTIICEEGEPGEYSITLYPEIKEEDKEFIEALKENFDYFGLLLKETEEEEKVEQSVEPQPQGFIKVEKVVWGYPCTTLQAVKKFLGSQTNENNERQVAEIEIFDAFAYLYLISEYQAKDSFALPVLLQIRKKFSQLDEETQEQIKSLIEDLGLKEKWDAAIPLEFEVNGVTFTFVEIPAGTFMFGDEEKDDQREVKIPAPFMMMAHEVTQKQWEAIMGNNPSNFKGEDLPVETVRYTEVQEFIDRLNELLVAQGLPNVRLPTEEEWEYAARAGSQTRYPWGDGEDGLLKYAWGEHNANGTTHKVMDLDPNAWGLYDMIGNVYEWVDSSSNTSRQQVRAIRGGGWRSSPENLRSVVRFYWGLSYRSENLGFRLVRDI